MNNRTLGLWALVVGAVMASMGGCAGTAARTDAEALGSTPVSQVGQMRSVMRDGHTEPRATLTEFVGSPHAFAVGAMAGLEGEVTVFDGQVWITRVVEGHPVSSGPHPAPDDKATLLIGAHVPAWRSITLPAAVGGDELEALIARNAGETGLDTTKPFPFRIEGEFAALDMHVINGFCPHSGGEAAFANQPWKFTGAIPIRAEIVGFYAEGSEGDMTHHGTAIHAHAIVSTQKGRITGHVDSLVAQAGATLLLPIAAR